MELKPRIEARGNKVYIVSEYTDMDRPLKYSLFYEIGSLPTLREIVGWEVSFHFDGSWSVYLGCGNHRGGRLPQGGQTKCAFREVSKLEWDKKISASWKDGQFVKHLKKGDVPAGLGKIASVEPLPFDP